MRYGQCKARPLPAQRSKDARIAPSELLRMNREDRQYLGNAFEMGGQFYPAIIGQFYAAIDSNEGYVGKSPGAS